MFKCQFPFPMGGGGVGVWSYDPERPRCPGWELAATAGSRSSPPPACPQHMREGKCYERQTAAPPPAPSARPRRPGPPIRGSCAPGPRPAPRVRIPSASPPRPRRAGLSRRHHHSREATPRAGGDARKRDLQSSPTACREAGPGPAASPLLWSLLRLQPGPFGRTLHRYPRKAFTRALIPILKLPRCVLRGKSPSLSRPLFGFLQNGCTKTCTPRIATRVK